MQKGQGALEYLLLIGGGVLVVAIVLTIMLGIAYEGGSSTQVTATTATDLLKQKRDEIFGISPIVLFSSGGNQLTNGSTITGIDGDADADIDTTTIGIVFNEKHEIISLTLFSDPINVCTDKNSCGGVCSTNDNKDFSCVINDIGVGPHELEVQAEKISDNETTIGKISFVAEILLCGNNQIDGEEECDGENFTGATCISEGFSGGTLSCELCELITGACEEGPVFPKGLVGFWKFEGNLIDNTGNYNGTEIGTLNYETGKDGLALSLDGTANTGAQILLDSEAGLYENNFTYAFWYKATDISSGNNVARPISRDCSDYFCLQIAQSGNRSGKARFYFSDTQNTGWKTIPNPTDWHHVAFVWDYPNLTFRWYLDGQQFFQNNRLATLKNSVKPVVIGGNTEKDGDISGNEFKGLVDEVMVFDRSLSEEEVQVLTQ